jgi:molybdate transport system substrate-binding protein
MIGLLGLYKISAECRIFKAMKKIVFLLLLLVFIPVHAQKLKVAAASNLRYVLTDILEEYKKVNPKADIQITLGASGSLVQQILNGAPFDVYMAADVKTPDYLKEQGFAVGEVRTYAYGSLVIWSKTIDLNGKGIEILRDTRVKRIAIARPEVAPYGEAAVECLRFYQLYGQIHDKLVYAENISQAAQMAHTGNADIAFLASSLLPGSELKDKGTFFVPSPESYHPIEQACVILKTGGENMESSLFINFILSPACRPLFEKYGYTLPK